MSIKPMSEPRHPSSTTSSSHGTSHSVATDNARRFPRSVSEPMSPENTSPSKAASSISTPPPGPSIASGPPTSRPCKEHSFLTDVADVRAMEHGLLRLLDDFHSGKLQAFDGDCTFEKMDTIREQQEKLAKQHFDLDLQHDMIRVDSEESRKNANESLRKLITQLEPLRESIQDINKSPDEVLAERGDKT